MIPKLYFFIKRQKPRNLCKVELEWSESPERKEIEFMCRREGASERIE